MAGLSPSVRDVARNFASISSPAHPGDAAGPVIRAQFDYKAIRAGAEGMRVNMKQRNYHSVDIDEVVRLIDERSALLFPMQEMRTRRNTVADAVSRRKTNKPLDPATRAYSPCPAVCGLSAFEACVTFSGLLDRLTVPLAPLPLSPTLPSLPRPPPQRRTLLR